MISIQPIFNRAYDVDSACDSFHKNKNGLSIKDIDVNKCLFGLNLIQISVLPVYHLILKEVPIF